MTLPKNITDANSLTFKQNDVQGQLNLRYYDNEMKEGEIGSRQFVTCVDVIAEGEIAGFPSAIDAGHTQGTNNYNTTALKDVFLNNVQVLQQSAPNTTPADSDFNFGTSDSNRPRFIPRFGTSTQTKIPGVKETERERPVGVTVTTTSPQVVSITDTNTEGIRVTIGFPRLQKIEDDGNISGTTVEYQISVKDQANTILKQINSSGDLSGLDRDVHTGGGSVTGKSTSAYFKDHIIFLPNDIETSDFPLTLTVTRVTADSTDVKLSNAFELTSITELVFEEATYTNTAVAALRFDAEIFRSVPQRMFRIRGRLIKIPHNSTVRADGSLSFTGTFNGTLKASKEYCNDPAWVLYDIITESRAGFGDFVSEDEVDKYAFYNASVYNSELINNNQGGTSPRFSCNIVIQTSTQAYTLLDKIASIMRASLFLEDGKITLTQDRPTTSSYFFSYANVTEDGFIYNNASKSTRDTVINVKYFQNETRTYEYETIEDTTANQTKFGVVVKNIEAIGCSDQAQARRMGLWHLYTQNNETETVAFTTTADAGSLIRPGNIITIQDPVRSGLRRSGRISAATTTQITVDNIKDLPTTPSTGDELSVILTDGSLQTKTISSISLNVITVDSAYSSAPQANSVWLFVRATTETEDFRVLSVKEDNNTFTISAMFHNPAKYAFVEDDTTITTPVIKNLVEIKDAPSNIAGDERIIVLGNRAVSKLIVSWQPVPGVSQYSVKHKFNNGSFQTTIVQSPIFEIFDTELGTYEFEVYSYNASFEPSVLPTTLTFNAVGKTAIPDDPTGLTSEPVSESFIRLRFNPSTSVDVTHGGTISVRHTSDTSTNASFANSTEIIPQLSGNISETLVPALTGTYSLKFIDDGGRRSANAAKIIVTKPDPQPNQIIVTKREDQTSPAFNGTRVRTVFSDEFNGLVLDGSQFFDNVADVNALANFDFLGSGIVSQGFYTFVDDLDLGSVFNLSLERHFKTAAIVVSDLWDSRVSLVNDMPDWDGTLAEDVGAKLQVATCQGIPTSSLSSTYSQTQDLITITRTSHGAVVNDQILVDFTNGNATDGFLKVASVTNANVFVAEAVRVLAEYKVVNASTGEIQFFTQGNHGGLVVNDTVNLRVLSGTLSSGDYVVGALLSANTVKITTSSNNTITSGTVEFIKVKDNSGNNVTTSGDCNISSAFSPFNIFANGEYNARGFRFRADIFSDDPDENIEIDELGYTASMKRRTETVNAAIASACATNNLAKTVVFGNPFYTGTSAINLSTTAFLPTIGITLEGAVSGDYFKITSVTGSQFVIETRDANNNFKDLSFKYTAVGFGKGV